MANTHNVAKSVPSPKKHEIRLNPAEFEKSIERSCKAVLLGPSNDCDELDTVVFCEMFSRRKSPEFVITDVQKFENKSVASVKPVTEPKKRWIVCAAVKTTDGVVHTGKRHSDCFTLIGALGWIRYHLGSEQGFVDNRWEFLTRSEAFKVAKKAGQILDEKTAKAEGRGVLYSEDIY